jgi:centrosomal protein CEP164
LAANGQLVDSSSGGDALIQEGFEILEEELDEDYEPSPEEIEEYAKYLGMDMNKDSNLFYIAKEGLKAPLPGPWKPCKSPDG